MEALSTEQSEPDAEQEFPELTEASFPLVRYKPLRLLEESAVVTTFKCFDRDIRRFVVIKQIHAVNGIDSNNVRQAAKIMGKLTHANIIQILDSNSSEGGIPYIVLEYFAGCSIREYLDNSGSLPTALAVSSFQLVSKALQYAHEQGVLHKALGVDKILLSLFDNELSVKVCDFGMAELLPGTVNSSTQSNWSPEQLRGAPLSIRSEIFSFGCVLFESVSGHAPFSTTGTRPELEPPVLSAQLAPTPQLRNLEDILSRCLDYNEAGRFNDFNELASALASTIPPKERLPQDLLDIGLDKNIESHAPTADNNPSRKPVLLLAGIALLIIVAMAAPPTLLNNLVTKEKEDVVESHKEKIDPMWVPSISSSVFPDEQKSAYKFFWSGNGWLAFTYAMDKDFDYLCDKNNLRVIKISAPVTGAGFSKLKGKTVTTISVESNMVNDAGVRAIADLGTVESLLLLGHPKLSILAFRDLVKLRKLTGLGLEMDLPDGTFQTLAQSPSLKTLYLKNCTGIDLKALSKLDLKTLLLHKSGFTNQDMSKISALLRRLESLSLTELGLSDAGLDELANYRHLRRIDLRGNKITDTTLKSLAACRSLEALCVAHCNNLTEGGLDRFRKARPECVLLLQDTGEKVDDRDEGIISFSLGRSR